MSNVPAANLLDDYLCKTAALKQDIEQSVPSTDVSAQTAILHQRVLQGVHAALDSALTSQGTPCDTIPRNRGDYGSVRTQATPVSNRAATVQDPGTTDGRCKGLFRAMREADALSMYSDQLASIEGVPGTINRTRHLQEMQQGPAYTSPANAVTSQVRLLADHAVLSTKLQKLQQDMDARSHKQSMWSALQHPSDLFTPFKYSGQPQQHGAAVQQQHKQQETPECRSVAICQSEDKLAGVLPSLNRPCTAPDLVYTAALKNSSDSNLQFINSRDMRQQMHRPEQHALHNVAAAVSGGDCGVGLVASAPPQLRHLKQVSDLQLPWQSAAAATPKALNPHHSSGPRCQDQPKSLEQLRLSYGVPGHKQQQATLRSISAGSAAFQSGAPSLNQQVQVSAPRPISAVTALQQSLNELQSLRVKYAQQQHQLEESHKQQQQQQHLQELRVHQRRQEIRHMATSPGSSWPFKNVEPVLSNNPHGSPLLANGLSSCDPGASAVHAASAPERSHQGIGRPAGDVRDYRQQRLQQTSWGRYSPPLRSYSHWDAWQQHVHADHAGLSPPRARLCAAVSPVPGARRAAVSLIRQQHAACASLMRSQSAPRLLRAWDVVDPDTLHARHAPSQYQRGGLFAPHVGPVTRLQRSVACSWDDSSWRLHKHQQHHEGDHSGAALGRPQTAAACLGVSTRGNRGLVLRQADISGPSRVTAVHKSCPTKGAGAVGRLGSGWLESASLRGTSRWTTGQRGQLPAPAAARSLKETAAGMGGQRSSWLGSAQQWRKQQDSVAAAAQAGTDPLSSKRGATATRNTSTGSARDQPHLLNAPAASPPGVCKAAMLASTAKDAVGAGTRALLHAKVVDGHFPQVRRSKAQADDASTTSDVSVSTGVSKPGDHAGADRDAAYAAALARVQAAKARQHRSSHSGGHRCSSSDDAGSSSSDSDMD